ncbi:MAG: dual specificity protein phosphatase [Candidatus Sulfotelmatobacter sp.]
MKRGSLNSREMDGRDALSVSPRVGPRGRKLGNADPWPDGWGRGLVVIDGVPMVEYPRDIRRKVSAAGNYGSLARRRFGMDITWLDDRIAVGGGIWSPENMAKVSLAGITHIIDMQIEFDDRPLAEPHGIAVCWNPVDDDFEFKPPEVFETGVKFALEALEDPKSKLFIHCAAGVHRAPMMTLALLGVMGWNVEDAMDLIETKRPVADFAEVYVRSVEEFLKGRS